MEIKIEYIKHEFDAQLYKRYMALKQVLGTFSRGDRAPYDFTSYYASYKRELNQTKNTKRVMFYHKKTNLTKTYSYNSFEELKGLKFEFKRLIQSQRDTNRYMKTRTGRFGQMTGKVYTESGLVLKKQIKSVLREYRESKVPKTNSRHIGVEIECFGPISDWIDLAIEFNKTNPDLVNHVCISSDGSIRPDIETNGYEIKVMASEDKITSVLNEVTSVLNRLGFSVNKSCGLHVHLDMRSRDAKRAYYNLVTMQSLLLKMQPKSRRSNQFCRRNVNKDLSSRFDNRKYKAINKRRLWDLNTLEVRLHAGSINADKINNWINLLIRIVDNEIINIPRVPTKPEKIGQLLKLDNNTVNYIKTRLQDVALAS